MGREERLLRRFKPGVESYTEADYAWAREVLSIAYGKVDKASSLPQRFVAVGEDVVVKGRTYRCVLREEVHWSDCCRGCAFQGCDCPPFLQCSKFDRRDGLNVWFEEV